MEDELFDEDTRCLAVDAFKSSVLIEPTSRSRISRHSLDEHVLWMLCDTKDDSHGDITFDSLILNALVPFEQFSDLSCLQSVLIQIYFYGRGHNLCHCFQ